MVEKKRMRLQWRRFKLATAGMILVAFVAVVLLYVGIMTLLGNSSLGYVIIFFGILLFVAVGYDVYRMYGY
ncbi:MAG: hypothetical protein QMD21_02410 [Candidatus Thermoplasmatota archaeon]|nr:hypothetical protein [Candidatus Thermoplasmatota archaeon]